MSQLVKKNHWERPPGQIDKAMPAFREHIRARAFKQVPGISYNQTLQEYDDMREPSGMRPLFYEVVIAEEEAWETFRDRVYPLFVRYLRYKRINPEQPQGVIVSVFLGERCYLLEGREFLAMFCEMEHLLPDALYDNILEWLEE